ncbi:hypothetical protein Clacol_005031 [Clathrus columnatus]|uniref:Uncharacterized protein n=1 Tax=Clathrus columnatus TaxID=1419009 RepID=A0AAV5ABE9_9AGAM|nr:hypothetical protein Clacol_005031 [Clathrus columnatus]
MRVGHPMTGYGMIKVVRSEDPRYTPGEYHMGLVLWQLYDVHPWDRGTPAQPGQYPDYTNDTDHEPLFGLIKLQKNHDISWPTTVAALGVPGQCAFYGEGGQVMYQLIIPHFWTTM